MIEWGAWLKGLKWIIEVVINAIILSINFLDYAKLFGDF